jgi:hypothetical protein
MDRLLVRASEFFGFPLDGICRLLSPTRQRKSLFRELGEIAVQENLLNFAPPELATRPLHRKERCPATNP